MLSIREATLNDVGAIARVDVETWRITYAGVLPDHLLVGLDTRQRTALWSRFVSHRPGDTLTAHDDTGTVIGFGSCGARKERDTPFQGEIFTLYVTPDWQDQGIGRSLLIALFRRLRGCRVSSVVVWVLADNPARFFYERVGGKLAARRVIQVGGRDVEALGYGWPDLDAAIAAGGITG
jgi:ribosomal protein S18 acetylase RimI-like enzyme